ncbi:MAG: TniQ family protein [Methylocystis sp.]|jgi:hypothetical protein
MIKRLDDAKPLPVILKPVPDELLSSWLSRHAAFYGMEQLEFLRHLLPDSHVRRLHAVDTDLSQSAAEKLGHFFRRDQAEVRRMTHCDLAREAKWFISPEPIQSCPSCRSRAPDFERQEAILRNSQRGWRITCSLCGRALAPLSASDDIDIGTESADTDVSPSTWDEAVEGERLLNQFLTDNEKAAAAAVAAFRMLLVPRPRLPSMAAWQPCKLHAVDALAPGFDALAERKNAGIRWKNHVIAPLRVRATLLAGFQRLLEKPRPRFHILRSVTLGHYRLRLETLGEQATPILGPLWFS